MQHLITLLPEPLKNFYAHFVELNQAVSEKQTKAPYNPPSYYHKTLTSTSITNKHY